MKNVRRTGIVVWLFAIIVLVIETPFGIWRLGLLPAPIVYVAAAIGAVGAWPIVAELFRARQVGHKRVAERERALRSAVDSPMRTSEHLSSRRVSPNDR